MNPICNSVHVRVPATSANLGSGFDTVGLALDYHDELTFTLNDDPNDGIAHVIIHGEGADALPCDETHLVVSTFRRACATFGLGPTRLHAGSDQQHPSGSWHGLFRRGHRGRHRRRRGLRPDR